MWNNGDIAPLILNLGTRYRRVVRLKTRLLYHHEGSPLYPLGAALGGTQSHNECFGEENISCHCGESK